MNSTDIFPVCRQGQQTAVKSFHSVIKWFFFPGKVLLLFMICYLINSSIHESHVTITMSQVHFPVSFIPISFPEEYRNITQYKPIISLSLVKYLRLWRDDIIKYNVYACNEHVASYLSYQMGSLSFHKIYETSTSI